MTLSRVRRIAAVVALRRYRRCAPGVGEVCYRHEFAPVELAVPAARHAVRAVCVRHGFDVFGPELVVAELVANALRHTAVDDFVGVTVRVSGGRMAVEVSDPGADAAGFLDSLVTPEGTDGHGRGLLLVTAVSDRVDITVSGGRKAVRALIAVDRVW